MFVPRLRSKCMSDAHKERDRERNWWRNNSAGDRTTLAEKHAWHTLTERTLGYSGKLLASCAIHCGKQLTGRPEQNETKSFSSQISSQINRIISVYHCSRTYIHTTIGAWSRCIMLWFLYQREHQLIVQTVYNSRWSWSFCIRRTQSTPQGKPSEFESTASLPTAWRWASPAFPESGAICCGREFPACPLLRSCRHSTWSESPWANTEGFFEQKTWTRRFLQLYPWYIRPVLQIRTWSVVKLGTMVQVCNSELRHQEHFGTSLDQSKNHSQLRCAHLYNTKNILPTYFAPNKVLGVLAVLTWSYSQFSWIQVQNLDSSQRSVPIRRYTKWQK